MSLIKQTIEEYCVVVHPGDPDAQDKLFGDIVNCDVPVTLEDMAKAVAEKKGKQARTDEMS